ncbi:MAG: fibronectin type III domain-containing protein, partial [Nocardioidaceae bacterium]
RLTVTQTGANVVGQKVSDGIDTLRNVEQARFSDQTISLSPPNAPVIGTATAANASATVTWTAPAGAATAGITGYEIVVNVGGIPVRTVSGIPATARTRLVTGLTNGTTYTLQVRAVNVWGFSSLSAETNPVTPFGPAGAPTAVVAVRGNQLVNLSWTAPASNGGSAITGYRIQVRTGVTVVRTIDLTGTATNTVVTGLNNGTAYNFRVATLNAAGASAFSTQSNTVTPATVPDAPGILAPAQGPAGGALTAVANWSAPANTGGSVIAGYRVSALQMAADGTTVIGTTTVNVGATIRTRSFTLANGTYRFEVVAFNAVGDSLPSARSDLVQPR